MFDSRTRTSVAITVSLAALAIIVGALWPRSDVVRTEAERADHIASRLRCPFCNGESIADATAQVARDLEVVIREQVAAGMTDDEIFDFYAERYGESLLLDPPLLGWGWALWVLPLGALVMGGVAVSRRRRRPLAAPVGIVGSIEEARAYDQLRHIARDRQELAEQQTAGEIDADTVDQMLGVLDEESEALTAALTSKLEPGALTLRLARRRRMYTGAGLLVVGAVAIGATLLFTADGGGGGGIVDAPPIDFAAISTDRLEEVVAVNPDVVPMRMLLAQMLMDEEDVVRAAFHFGEILKREDNAEAMAWIGWISFLAGEHETAEGFLEDALSLVPNYPQAQWWLANVRFLGLGDPVGAVDPLESLLASAGVPDNIRGLAETMLGQIRDPS